MSHKIVIDIDVRTCDEQGQPLDEVIPNYHNAITDALIKAGEEAKVLGLYVSGSILQVDSELVHWDDPRATLRFTFIHETLGE